MHAHIDCFSGAAGDMLLAACLDAAAANGRSDSVGTEALRSYVEACINGGLKPLQGEFQIQCRTVWRGKGSIAAKHVNVTSVYNHQPAPVPQTTTSAHDHSHSHSHDHSHSHSSPSTAEITTETNETGPAIGPFRNLKDIRQMLQSAPEAFIPAWVREMALDVFTKLAQAEATVHGVADEDSIHFHEVGAVDSIVDTVGTLLALHKLRVTTVSCGPLPMSQGMVNTAHGLLPVPAPATLQLMIGFEMTQGPPGATGELVTPTGAALLNVLTTRAATAATIHPSHGGSRSSCPPGFTLRKVGVGAGTKNFENHPNILRILLGDLKKETSTAPLVVDQAGDIDG